jgi:multisubunit Na+/H+ antiporter MnhB subunit
MRYKYVVILKNDRERATDAISMLLCLFSAGMFLHSSFRNIQPNYIGLALSAVLLIGLAGTLILARRRPKPGHRSAPPIRYRYWLLLSAVGWFALTTTPVFGAFFFLFAMLEYQAKRSLEIGFDDDRVVINNIVRQRYDWSAFNNVVLKDGLLTLDFKNNRLLQKEVADDDEEDDADEEEFNAFCRGRLGTVAPA